MYLVIFIPKHWLLFIGNIYYRIFALFNPFLFVRISFSSTDFNRVIVMHTQMKYNNGQVVANITATDKFKMVQELCATLNLKT